MAATSRIEWTDATWNVITGCSRVSEGCRHCYAERLAATRLRRHPSRAGLVDGNRRWNGQVRFNAQWLDQPLDWQRPRRIFVCAHGDLFFEAVPDEWIDRVFTAILRANFHGRRHTYQVLTKRPQRMRDYLRDPATLRRVQRLTETHGIDRPEDAGWPPHNVWPGVSVEHQDAVHERLPVLLTTPGTLLWVSAEPLLDAITLPTASGRSPGWVVVGGESGPGARALDPRWVRSLREQCGERGIPFFFKQWGGTRPGTGGRLLDGRCWDEMPTVDSDPRTPPSGRLTGS